MKVPVVLCGILNFGGFYPSKDTLKRKVKVMFKATMMLETTFTNYGLMIH